MKKIDGHKRLYRLKGVIQNYDWGGSSFIPLVTGEAFIGKPMAEYWLGAHKSAPSMIINSEQINLDRLIESDTEKYLGKEVSKTFNQLPFLLKLLDVKEMLSIQVHPSSEEAKLDFKRENELGIPLDSPIRNYKDENHKPELMVAMSEFWLLHGFKESKPLTAILHENPELNFLIDVFESQSYEGLYSRVMTMPQEEVNKVLTPLRERIIPLYESGKLKKSSEDYWAAKAFISFYQEGIIDRGIFSIYFFNLVSLKKGQAIFQDAGVPHAYLEGTNVEIMASSDNVLRGGLTTKHIAVEELLRHVKCESTVPEILTGRLEGKERVFNTNAPDFELSVIEVDTPGVCLISTHSPEIYLLTSGEVSMSTQANELNLRAGEPSAICFPGNEVQITFIKPGALFRAKVPIHNR